MSRRFLACVVVAVLALCTGCTSGPSSPRQLEAGLAQQLDTAITDTLRTTEILLDEQGVAVSFRAPMAVQDETGKSMLEEKKSK
jgi:hypothetical protein